MIKRSLRWVSAPLVLATVLIALPLASGVADAATKPPMSPAGVSTGTKTVGVFHFPAAAVRGKAPLVTSQADIICYLNVQNPHKSTHVPENVNVVATVSCNLPPAALALTVALYYWTGSSWVLVGIPGQVVNYGRSFIQANSATTCRNGLYEGAAAAEAVAPPGYVPPVAYADGYSAPVPVTC